MAKLNHESLKDALFQAFAELDWRKKELTSDAKAFNLYRDDEIDEIQRFIDIILSIRENALKGDGITIIPHSEMTYKQLKAALSSAAEASRILVESIWLEEDEDSPVCPYKFAFYTDRLTEINHQRCQQPEAAE